MGGLDEAILIIHADDQLKNIRTRFRIYEAVNFGTRKSTMFVNDYASLDNVGVRITPTSIIYSSSVPTPTNIINIG